MAKTRKATARDLPAIYELVRELAIFEKAEDQLKATLEDYQRDFTAGVFEAVVLEYANEICGMVLFYLTYSTWRGKMLYLEDFVVAKRYRRRGYGQQLFDAFIAAAHEKNCAMVKWQVLDWNEAAVKFYEKNQATIEKQWWNGKIIF